MLPMQYLRMWHIACKVMFTDSSIANIMCIHSSIVEVLRILALCAAVVITIIVSPMQLVMVTAAVSTLVLSTDCKAVCATCIASFSALYHIVKECA